MNNFELENQLVIISLKTLSVLFAEEDGADAVALYSFYYMTAKKQETNQVWASQSFCMKGLKWGDVRFLRAKKLLEKYDLIEIIKGKGMNDKWYIKVKYVRSNSPQNKVVRLGANSPQNELVDSKVTNALGNKYINASSTNVEDTSGFKKPSCPLLNGSPLKDNYPLGHEECIEYYLSVEDRRGFKFINKPKQFMFIHKILRAGYGFDQMNRAIKNIERKWDKGSWDFGSMANWLEKGAGHGES